MKSITPMVAWLRAATLKERETLAEYAGTSVGHLRQLAGGHRTASPDLAGRIEVGTQRMHAASGGRLPEVVRTDLAPACRACPYAHRCLGARATVSEFPILEAECANK